MSESLNPDDVTAQNERSLSTLIRAIVNAQGRFSLILVRCNYGGIQEQILAEVRQRSGLDILAINLQNSSGNLYSIMTAEIGKTQPNAVMIFGLESVGNLDDFLVSINRLRDDFLHDFPFPLVLWINDLVLQKLIKLAPDFYSYAPVPIRFAIATQELFNFLHKEAEEIFTKILAAGADQFLDNAALNLTIGAGKRFEIESALQELQKRGCEQPEIAASQKFILGRDAYAKNQMEESRQLYAQSLAFWWQQFIDENHNQESAALIQKNLEKQACILFHLGLWWRRYAVLHRAEYDKACRCARNYYQRCIKRLQKANRPDLAANFINVLAEVLQQLEEWEKLETIAKKAVELHTKYYNPIRLANAYAAFAEVALAKSQWKQAKEYAEIAINKISQTSSQDQNWGIQYYMSWYLLLLAQSKRHLGQLQEALNNLEIAKEECKPEYNPKLYIRILEELRNFYFEQHQYLTAFHLKQEQSSIEQQYGLRAFIGAGRLQSQRQVIHPALVALSSGELYNSVLGAESKEGTIAQEIVASGRKYDVDKLIERISRDDHKLIVIHGPSGVGKSSLLTAGLVPALHQITVFEGRNILPVVVQVYTDWVEELGNLLQNTTPEAERGEGEGGQGRQGGIIEELRRNVELNLVTVLIFDQFEEFFFNCPNPVERRKFWEFLHLCLDSFDLPYVKVILSLREDYLHYLLECDKLTNLEVTKNDILNKQTRYAFGNLQPEAAKLVIQSLTERSFYLEPQLIDELVRDLAGELLEVRPIELQVLGAQLQTENITTLEKYQQSGPKDKLVERFLDAIVKDCGAENERAAQLVLYLLTDENNTRPLKTKAELAAALAAEADKLDLVLEILVTSGIVFLIPQSPADRYQLVHDYLVAFIRQQRGAELLAELEREKEQRKLIEAKLNKVLKRRLREAYLAGLGLATLAVVAAVFGVQSFIANINAQINLISTSSEAFFASEQDKETLIESLKAAVKLQSTPQLWVASDTRTQVIVTLWQAIYGVKDIELKSFTGHNDWVFSVSFAPDGKTIASASLDNTIKLWSLDGKLVKTFTGHSAGIYSVSFSPDGKTIASASADNTIKLWSLDGKLVKTFTGHSSEVYSVSFSPDGKTIASASADNTIKLWSLDGKLVKTFTGHSSEVYSVSFSPDGKTIASATRDNTIKIWSLDGKELKTLTGHSVSFSPDGKTIASVGGDNIIKIWSLDGKELKTFIGHRGEVYSVSFAPDGKTIASASHDNTIKIWSLEGKEPKTFTGHSDSVSSVSFAPDGKTIASASRDNTIKIWSLEGKEPKTFSGYSTYNTPAYINPEYITSVSNVSFAPDGKTIASVGGDNVGRNNTITIWSLDGKELKTFTGYSVSFAPDGKTIASASHDDTIKLWSLDGKLLKTFTGHSDLVSSVSFAPDGKTITSASHDNTIKLWSLDGKLLKTFTGHSAPVYSVSFAPDGKTIASASRDKTIKLWSLDGKLLKTLTAHSAPVYSVSFAPDSKTIVSASHDKTIKLWSLDGKLIKTFKGHSAPVYNVSFVPDGKILASASHDKTIKLWSLDGKLIKTFKGHSAPVYNVSFAPDGKTIASASRDNTVILWNLNLDNLVVLGCNWLQDYLPNHPETLAELQPCQNQFMLMTAATTLVAQGEELASVGEVEKAVTKFKQAKQWNPQLHINPETKTETLNLIFQGKELAKQIDIQGAVAKFKKAQNLTPNIDLELKTTGLDNNPEAFARKLAISELDSLKNGLSSKGDFKKAISAYAKAEKIDPKLEIAADDWNILCWDGSLYGYAANVMFACEKAVTLAPKNGDIRDSRGLARALTGYSKGAIADFQAFIQWSNDSEQKSKRQAWVNDLKAGKNPFTEEELQKLRQ
ncbi:nSTAND1 domain-containing NTPase [Calothrix sp. NIES-2098]|uniref:WD40 domain-containing protein n=1 Tax=Calothrix sp. NIES-2098 TaxID=1954171 RepID=UPI000B61B1B6|nr:WD-40 repeat-containing protein [Calothrix sp. NIES-2098]